MNHLLRELAPISDAAWAEIDTEATRTLTHFFAARKLVDFEVRSATTLPRWPRTAQPIDDQPAVGVTASRRQLLPLSSCARKFTLSRAELESIDRGADDPDLDPVVDACRALAMAEDTLVFAGNDGLDIVGIGTASPHDPIP